MPIPAPDPFLSLASAITTNDSSAAAQLLATHPDLHPRLNDPYPNAPFGQTLLLRHGADVNARSRWWAGGFGVLDSDHGLHDFLLARGATLTPHAAARLGRLDDLLTLLTKDPSLVHARGGDGQTPLHVAATVEVASLLLDRGADPDALDVDHESTPAQYLIKSHPDVAAHLVARGARTDLLLATALGDEARVRAHLDENPASLRITVSPEYFPMRHPHAGGHIYTWTLGNHKTAHQVAHDKGHADVLRLLIDRSPAPLQLAAACDLADEPLVDSLCRAGVTPAPEDFARIAAAALNNNTPAVHLFLRAGWPTDPRSQHGATPLHWAAFHGNPDMTAALLAHHAPLELTDHDHHGTPLAWATFGSKHGWHTKTGDYAQTVELLLAAGAATKPFDESLDASEAVRDILRRHAAK
jgi:ankyrin repeat protein